MNGLLRYVERGDLASVQARIGADRSLLNARRGTSYTALACAVSYDRLHIARYLLGEGAQVNEGDGTGSPALRQAVSSGPILGMTICSVRLKSNWDSVNSSSGLHTFNSRYRNSGLFHRSRTSIVF
jgi:ankyrin repeat protein